ncbi:hypothetical protein SAMN02745174_02293 [Cetobacterium ceti]|uniref:Uncharacterized protein n=1 Tax=Cetobacterium ceti TaxID=180163 RepID=A0A1T4QDT0_9FUSO|nr:hypothetical protein [Cetobacterium ceti]SKA01899.1 hypothetical protein SAMN02745174_02293 [Cetobacterium ceti]
MEIIYDSSKLKDYKIKKTISDEIIQNIENILSRIKGNIPLNREKGIDTALIDEPLNLIQPYLISILIDEIEREEPRFKVNKICFDTDFSSQGKLIIKVKGEISHE